MLDFEKAFDSLEWPTINKALEYHGFGPVFISWIKILQSSPTSCILNNGNFCRFFKISRGVRQGCPLSPYIFILTIEVLANAIRSSAEVKGISIYNHETKLNMYADDVTLLLIDDPTNIQNCLDIIKKFGFISGLKLNDSKTEFCDLGTNRSLPNQKTVNLLGTKLNNDAHIAIRENLIPIFNKINAVIKVWNQRNLSLFGRIYITRSLCVSKLIHILAVLPNIPEGYIKTINTTLFKYIWKNGNEKLRRKVLTGPWDLGGAGMIDIKSLITTLHLKWIGRLWDDTIAPWKTWIEYHGKIPNTQHLFECNLDPDNHMMLLNNDHCNIWSDIILTWCKQNYETHIHGWNKTLAQVIWLNGNIKVNGVPVCFNKWYLHGIVYIEDLVLLEEKRFFTFHELSGKYNLTCPFIQYHSIIDAIPKVWKQTIKSGPICNEELEVYTHKIEGIKNMTHKEIYSDIVSKKCDIPEEKFSSWCKDLNLNTENLPVDELDWIEDYRSCFSWTKSIVLRSFEYRFRMRILPPNSLLFKMGVVDYKECHRCSTVVEDIIHIFWDCPPVKGLWSNISDWLHEHFEYDIETDKGLIFMNLLPEDWDFPPEAVQLCILIAKKYIWTNRCLKRGVSLAEWIKKIQEAEEDEANIAIKGNKIPYHNLKWGSISRLQGKKK